VTAAATQTGILARSSPLFEGLTDVQVRRIMEYGEIRRVTRGEVLLTHGDPVTRLFVLLSGMAKLSLVTEAGAEILLRWFTSGEVAGLRTLVPQTAAVGTLAMTRPGQVIVWERSNVLRMKAEFPRLVENSLQVAIGFLADLTLGRTLMLTRSAEDRIRYSLLDLAHRIGMHKPQGVEIDIRNHELAAITGVSQYTASRILSRWQRQGLLSKVRGKIVLSERGLREEL